MGSGRGSGFRRHILSRALGARLSFKRVVHGVPVMNIVFELY